MLIPTFKRCKRLLVEPLPSFRVNDDARVSPYWQAKFPVPVRRKREEGQRTGQGWLAETVSSTQNYDLEPLTIITGRAGHSSQFATWQ